jgi:CrcB protein
VITYLWVGFGSALGGMARYGFGLVAARLWGTGFPVGTILINIVGSFIISFFGTLTLADGPFPANPSLRAFVMVGICGGFTTFSSFSLQTLELAQDDAWLAAFANIAISVVLCLLAVAAGYLLAVRIGALRMDG